MLYVYVSRFTVHEEPLCICADLTPADQDAARSLLQLLYLDGWVGGDGAVAGDPVPQQAQQRVVQLG